MKLFVMGLVAILGIAACAVEPAQEPESFEEPETSESSQDVFSNGICIAVTPGTAPGAGCIGAPLGNPCRLNAPDPITYSIAGQCQPVQLLFPVPFEPQYRCTCRQGPLENI